MISRRSRTRCPWAGAGRTTSAAATRTIGILLLALGALAAACGGDAATDAGGGGESRQDADGSSGGGVHFGDTGRFDTPGSLPDGGGAAPDAAADVPLTGCRGDLDCPTETPRCDPARSVCVECLSDGDCTGGATCLSQRCIMGSETCTVPGARECRGDEIVVCGPDGRISERIDCRPNVCLAGQCALCRPAELSCREGVLVRCKDDASGFTVVDDCADEGGCFDGRCIACQPGTGRCEAGVAQRCADDGSGWVVQQDCNEYGYDCVQGTCLNPCSTDPKTQTNAGCDFYALDLDNAYVASGGEIYDAQNAQFAVVVGNTSAEKSARVTVTLPDAAATTIVRDVPPRGLETFRLDPTWSLDGTVRNRHAFRVQSTRPVTVYQFNPLSNQEVFSNDASVLLPTPSLGTEYYIATLPTTDIFRGYFAIVAVDVGTTDVTIRPTANTAAGTGVPAMAQGVEHGVVLERGEVLNIEAAEPDTSLAGTYIRASQRVVVFAGHEAAVTGEQCCADHLEQQLLPVSRWGTTYVATRSMRRLREKDHWQVVASVDGTTLTIRPPIAGAPAVLNAGGTARFQSDQDFVLTASAPVLLVQYLASSFEILEPMPLTCSSPAQCPDGYECYGSCEAPMCGPGSPCPAGHTCVAYPEFGASICEPIGDPAMILSVPAEQYRKEFVFLTPDSYLEDYANVIAPVGTLVHLDGSPLATQLFTAVGDSGFAVQRVRLSDGVHVISADEPVGLVVYGYDDDVSYGYPGGLGLEDLQQ